MPAMPGADFVKARLDRCYDDLENKAVQCADRYNATVDHIFEWRFVLGPALPYVNRAMNNLRANMEKVFQLIRTAVEHHIPVVSLIVQSFKWLEDVQAPVNRLTHQKNHLAQYWKGDAGAAYQDKIPPQNDAIAAIGLKADQVSKWLMDIAKYNVDYMVRLSKLATDFIGAMVGAALEAATVVEIPFAVDALATAIGTLVGDALHNLVDIANRFVEALSKVRDIMSLMSDPKLAQGWPQAVTG
ncbi:hypothetical protein [Lentzea sp. NPDC051838]|uniref:hypothetical protein n=1 Tax=Lentzea sp. NPDC051838 TaxID=3154849 RepID=UPI003429BCFA